MDYVEKTNLGFGVPWTRIPGWDAIARNEVACIATIPGSASLDDVHSLSGPMLQQLFKKKKKSGSRFQ